MVKSLPFNVGSVGWISSLGAKIPHTSRPKKTKQKQKRYCNTLNKDFKNGPHQKRKRRKPQSSSIMLESPWIPVSFLEAEIDDEDERKRQGIIKHLTVH